MTATSVQESRLIPESESLRQYLHEIRQYHPLSPEEEARLVEEARRGNEKAREQLIKANLRFVVSIASQYAHLGIPLEDLISEGNLGLIRALETYDPSRGFRFITYAVWWIRHAIQEALRKYQSPVYVPVPRTLTPRKLTECIRAFVRIHDREPTLDELARECRMPPEKIQRLLFSRTRVQPFLRSSSRDGESSHSSSGIELLPLLIDPGEIPEELNIYNGHAGVVEQVHHKSVRRLVFRLLRNLSPRERRILCAYFGIGKFAPQPIDEIARQEGISRERVRQILHHALEKLRLWACREPELVSFSSSG